MFQDLGRIVGEDGFVERERGFPGVRRFFRILLGGGGIFRGFHFAFGPVRVQEQDGLVFLVRAHVFREDRRLELDLFVREHEFQIVDAVLFAQNLHGRLPLEPGQIAVSAAVEQKLDDRLGVAPLRTGKDREMACVGERSAGALDRLLVIDLPRGALLECAELVVRKLEVYDAAVADQDVAVFELGFGDRVEKERSFVVVEVMIQQTRRVSVILQDAFQQRRSAAPDSCQYVHVGFRFGVHHDRDGRPGGETAEGCAVDRPADRLGMKRERRQACGRRADEGDKAEEMETSGHGGISGIGQYNKYDAEPTKNQAEREKYE